MLWSYLLKKPLKTIIFIVLAELRTFNSCTSDRKEGISAKPWRTQNQQCLIQSSQAKWLELSSPFEGILEQRRVDFFSPLPQVRRKLKYCMDFSFCNYSTTKKKNFLLLYSFRLLKLERATCIWAMAYSLLSRWQAMNITWIKQRTCYTASACTQTPYNQRIMCVFPTPALPKVIKAVNYPQGLCQIRSQSWSFPCTKTQA